MGESIGLRYKTGLLSDIVENGIDLWRRCETYGTGFPSFVNGGDGSRTIIVKYIDRNSGTNSCGWFQGYTITLYDSAITSGGKPIQCGSIAQNLAHELGHVLGLRDLSGRRRCRIHIMGPITPRTMYGRWVSREECESVDHKWISR